MLLSQVAVCSGAKIQILETVLNVGPLDDGDDDDDDNIVALSPS